MKTRNCEACGADCKGKKVWEQRGKKVICMTCGAVYTFNATAELIKRAPRVSRRRSIAELDAEIAAFNADIFGK